MRALWTDPAALQIDVAAAASTSQSAVSQAIADLAARSPGELERLYREAYPGPKGEITYWRSEMSTGEQSCGLSKLGAVISGDAAADVLAPWRTPTALVAYSARALTESEMFDAGFVIVDEARDANVVLITGTSDTALLRQVTDRAGVLLAHPLHVAYDLRRLGGEDRSEAADVLLERLRRTAGDVAAAERAEQNAEPTRGEHAALNGAPRMAVDKYAESA